MTRPSARAVGLLLLFVPFLPIEWLFGPLRDTALGYVEPSEWLLGLFVFGSIGWLVAWIRPGVADAVAAAVARVHRALRGPRLAVVLLSVLAVLLVATSAVAFHHRPLLVDSVVQVFQAEIFATGRLTAPAPPGEAFVATQHMLIRDGRWFAQYPPGHAALLAVGVLAGVPWIVPVLLSLATAAIAHRFAHEAWDAPTGRVTLALFLLAPFFWVMGASFMNHVTCLFAVTLFLFCFRNWEADGSAAWALSAGLAIGGAGLARPLTALAVAAVFAPIGLLHGVRARRWGSIALAGAGGFVAVGLYCAYNAATTGDPLVPGYLALWGDSHGVGFHTSPWGDAHTPLTGLRNELLDLSMLATFLLEWPLPALLPAGLYLALTGGRNDWDRRMAAGLVALPAAYFFYWHRDAYLGPRFLYTGVVFVLPLTARALLAMRELPSGRLRVREAAVLTVTLCFAYSVLYAAPRRLVAYGDSFASMKVDLPAVAEQAGIDRGVVFVGVSWGNRLLARMRHLGARASTAERAYRRTDHCELELLLERARAAGWAPEEVDRALLEWPPGGVHVGAVVPGGDPTVRLTPGRPLAAACVRQLEHDRRGVANWLPFLLDNDPDLRGDVLYVRDLVDWNPEFLERRPGRPGWLYRPGGLVPLASSRIDPSRSPRADSARGDGVDGQVSP